MRFGVWGLGFGVGSLKFVVWGLGFGVWGLGFGISSLGFGGLEDYMGTSLTRKRTPLGPNRRPMPRVLGGS